MIGTKRNGTLVNGGQIVSGVVGNAIELNGANEEYVEYGFINESCLMNMDECMDGFTITLWTQSLPSAAARTVVGMGCGKQVDREGIRVELGGNLAYINAKFSDERQLAIFRLLSDGWVHHGVIIKKGQIPQYVMNETVQTRVAGNIFPATNTIGRSVRIGALSEPTTTNHFIGKIDDVRLWKVAKCPEFIKYIYDMYKP